MSDVLNDQVELIKARAEIERLRTIIKADGDEFDRLRAALERAYEDAKQAAVNPFLADELDENDGPWELQKKIGIAIDFRKKLALANEQNP